MELTAGNAGQVGTAGQTNESVNQHVWVFPDNSKKYRWLAARVVQFLETGKVCHACCKLLLRGRGDQLPVLAGTSVRESEGRGRGAGKPSERRPSQPKWATISATWLCNDRTTGVFVDSWSQVPTRAYGCDPQGNVRRRRFCVCAATHHVRSRHSQFKKGIAKGLVATDVAARGLDIKARCSAFAIATQCCVSSVVLLLAGYSHCSELRRSNEDRHTRPPMRPHRTYGTGWS